MAVVETGKDRVISIRIIEGHKGWVEEEEVEVEASKSHAVTFKKGIALMGIDVDFLMTRMDNHSNNSSNTRIISHKQVNKENKYVNILRMDNNAINNKTAHFLMTFQETVNIPNSNNNKIDVILSLIGGYVI